MWRGFLDPPRCRIEKTKTVPCDPPDVEIRAKRVLDPSCHANEKNCVSDDVWTEHGKYTCKHFTLQKETIRMPSAFVPDS
jgi:hypothetical protein